ncbi:MAG: hypothetical protein QGF46_08675, partial [Planctomycetota bacterium]|nr:hypothetical protein [Planctomycetota bacterium]
IVLHDSETGKDIKLSQSGAETVAYVFKVEKIGSNEIAYVRLFAGDLAAGQDMILERTGDSFVVEDCFTVLADDLQSKATFVCGSLFVIKSSIPLRSGDTLRTTKMRGALEPEQLSSPVVSMTVEASDSALREDLLTKCQWLCCVDPSLLLNLEGGQIVIQGQGQLHLQIAANHLRKRCDYPLRFGRVMVENYESVSVTIEHQTSYAHFDSPDSALLMSLECVPSTEHGIRLKYSPLLSGFAHSFLQSLYSADTFVGWVGPQGLPIRGLELTIKRLEWSEGVDACPDLLIAALHQCLTEVIELKGVTQRPYLNFEVRIPESELAAVLADLQQRNAEISAVEHQEGRAVVFAGAFLEHLSDYSNELRSQSHGLAELAFGAQSWRS